MTVHPMTVDCALQINGRLVEAWMVREGIRSSPIPSVRGDIKDIYAEGKSAGFDVRVLRQLIRIRRLEPAEVEEQETVLDVYRRALGM